MYKLMAKCSEYAQSIHDMAIMVAANPNVRTLDQVVTQIQKLSPKLTKEAIADSIVEAIEANARQVDETVKVLARIKAEARGNVKLRKQINKLQDYLRRGVAADPVQKKEQRRKVNEDLKAIKKDLENQLKSTEPAKIQREKMLIKRLEEKIAMGITPKVVVEKDIQLTGELADLQFKREQLQREVRKQLRGLKPTTMWQGVSTFFNVVRALLTSYDFSGVLRQGGFVVMGHPVLAAKAMVPMFKAFGSKKQEFKIDQWIKSHPSYSTWVRSGLFINPVDGDNPRTKEEQMQYDEKFVKWIPGIAASNRAYSTFLNVIRVQAFETMAEGLSKNGEITSSEAKALAAFVNAATGRGSMGEKMNRAASDLNVAFFAPRYVASRFQLLLTPLQLAAGKGTFGNQARLRKQIAKEYARYLIGMMVVYALAKLAGGEDEWDPRSSDFGKIRFGNTRLDPLSGMSQVTVLLGRLALGGTKSSITGEIKPIRGKDVGWGGSDAWDIGTRFLRYKLSPMFGTTVNLLTGEDAIGQPYEPATLKGVGDFVVPLSMREIFESIQEQGVPKGTAMSMMAIFGMGVQTYGSTTMKKKKNGSGYKPIGK
jgi:hypothetical protein